MKFNLINILKACLKEFGDLIYKRKCIECNCSIPDGILCKTCAKTVQNLPCFAQDFINGYKLFCAFYYEGAIKTLIHELKFRHHLACAHYAAEFLYDYIQQIKEYEKDNINFENAIIIPVLTHKKNYNKRGYDNVLKIAEELSLLTGFQVNKNALIKAKYTEPMYRLKAKDRKANIKDSFCLDNNFKTDSLVILLDDVTTTGTTLEFITSLFKENGFKNLICLTLAKTKYKK